MGKIADCTLLGARGYLPPPFEIFPSVKTTCLRATGSTRRLSQLNCNNGASCGIVIQRSRRGMTAHAAAPTEGQTRHDDDNDR